MEVDDKFFYNSKIDESVISKQSLIDFGPNSDNYTEIPDEKINKDLIKTIGFIMQLSTIRLEKIGMKKVANFINKFLKSYNVIYHSSR